jgi:hypothetical protein
MERRINPQSVAPEVRTQSLRFNPEGNNMARKSNSGGESIAGYFRKVFEDNPGWLKERSNDKLLQKWLADHPGVTEAPTQVKKGLGKIKSILRSKKRKKVARLATESQPASQQPQARVARVATGGSKLEALEFQIDECLIAARHLDREGLHEVIAMLRRARNAVVWKLGQ